MACYRPFRLTVTIRPCLRLEQNPNGGCSNLPYFSFSPLETPVLQQPNGFGIRLTAIIAHAPCRDTTACPQQHSQMGFCHDRRLRLMWKLPYDRTVSSLSTGIASAVLGLDRSNGEAVLPNHGWSPMSYWISRNGSRILTGPLVRRPSRCHGRHASRSPSMSPPHLRPSRLDSPCMFVWIASDRLYCPDNTAYLVRSVTVPANPVRSSWVERGKLETS